MNATAQQVEAAKQEHADWIKRQPGNSGVEFQVLPGGASRVFVLTNGMTPATKASIQDRLQGVMPVVFHEMGPVQAQAKNAQGEDPSH
jgi:hypothetical protein